MLRDFTLVRALSGPQVELSLYVGTPEKLVTESYLTDPIFPLTHFGNFEQTRRFAFADGNFRLEGSGEGSRRIAIQLLQDPCSGLHPSLGSTKHICFQCSFFELVGNSFLFS